MKDEFITVKEVQYILNNLVEDKKILVLVPSKYRVEQLKYVLYSVFKDISRFDIRQIEDFVILLYGCKYNKNNINEILELSFNWWEMYIISIYNSIVTRKLNIFEEISELLRNYKTWNQIYITGKKIAKFIQEFIEYNFLVDDLCSDTIDSVNIPNEYKEVFKIYLQKQPVDRIKCFKEVIYNFDSYKEYLRKYCYCICENLNFLPKMYNCFIEKLYEFFGDNIKNINFVERAIINQDIENDNILYMNLKKVMDLINEIKQKVEFFSGITAIDEVQWIIQKIIEITRQKENISICLISDDETFISTFEFITQLYNDRVEDKKIVIKKEFYFKSDIVWHILNAVANFLRGYFRISDIEVLFTSNVSKFKLEDEIYKKIVAPYFSSSFKLWSEMFHHSEEEIRNVLSSAFSYGECNNTDEINKVVENIMNLYKTLQKLKTSGSVLSSIIENFINENILTENVKQILKEAIKTEEKMDKLFSFENNGFKLSPFEKFELIVRYLSMKEFSVAEYDQQGIKVYLLPSSEAQFLEFDYVFVPNLTENVDKILPLYLSDEILNSIKIPDSKLRGLIKKLQILNCIKNAKKTAFLSLHRVEHGLTEKYHSFTVEALGFEIKNFEAKKMLYELEAETSKNENMDLFILMFKQKLKEILTTQESSKETKNTNINIFIFDPRDIVRDICCIKMKIDSILLSQYSKKGVMRYFKKDVISYTNIIDRFINKIRESNFNFENSWEEIKQEYLKSHPELILDEFEYYATKERTKILFRLEQEFFKEIVGDDKFSFYREKENEELTKMLVQNGQELKFILLPDCYEEIKTSHRSIIVLHFYTKDALYLERLKEEEKKLSNFLLWLLSDKIEGKSLIIRYVSTKFLKQTKLEILKNHKNINIGEILKTKDKYEQYKCLCSYADICKILFLLK
ncbi:MAG: hypothetical protein NZ928_04970 [Endomicrobia bacterium]|nr:hypothetical protein [Endomicrobiia bacterium]MDW8056135.1 hypothetical protein [Elusimicrobiota bacterium]